jgi:hypothetical protein
MCVIAITVAMAWLSFSVREAYYVYMNYKAAQLLQPRYNIIFKISVHEIVLYSLIKQR